MIDPSQGQREGSTTTLSFRENYILLYEKEAYKHDFVYDFITYIDSTDGGYRCCCECNRSDRDNTVWGCDCMCIYHNLDYEASNQKEKMNRRGLNKTS